MEHPVTQPGHPTRQRRGGLELTVNYEQILDGLHGRYQAVIGQIMQENSELTSGAQNLTAENAELKAKVAALQANAGVRPMPAPAASASA